MFLYILLYIVICFVSFALCYFLITHFVSLLFVLGSFSCFVCLPSMLCVLRLCIVLCIVSPQVHSFSSLPVDKFTDRCHPVETQLQLVKIIYISHHTRPRSTKGQTPNRKMYSFDTMFFCSWKIIKYHDTCKYTQYVATIKHFTTYCIFII